MEEKKIKKKKLTLSVSSKKPYNPPNFTQERQKKSVLIEKKYPFKGKERKYQSRESNFNKPSTNFHSKNKKPYENFSSKNIPINRNFEIRKIAEERATKRFKGLKEDDLHTKTTNLV